MLKLLFTPIKVGTLELKNRIVMPAMHYLSSWEGMVLPHHSFPGGQIMHGRHDDPVLEFHPVDLEWGKKEL